MVDYGKFEKLNVQLLAIGASNPFSQKTFADSMQLPYPLLSDYPDLKVIRQYGVLTHKGEAKRPMAKGSYFLIDKEGILRGVWMHPEGMEVFPSDPFLQMARELEEKS
jgi:peroxiredoxin